MTIDDVLKEADADFDNVLHYYTETTTSREDYTRQIERQLRIVLRDLYVEKAKAKLSQEHQHNWLNGQCTICKATNWRQTDIKTDL